jgi:hypothetical protein
MVEIVLALVALIFVLCIVAPFIGNHVGAGIQIN